MRRNSRFSASLAWLATLCGAGLAQAQPEPLQVHGEGRYLVTQPGQPFFWLADTAWHQPDLTEEQVQIYLADRVAKGFTVIQGPTRRANQQPDAYGEVAFIGDDTDRPTEADFSRRDLLVDEAGLQHHPERSHHRRLGVWLRVGARGLCALADHARLGSGGLVRKRSPDLRDLRGVSSFRGEEVGAALARQVFRAVVTAARPIFDVMSVLGPPAAAWHGAAAAGAGHCDRRGLLL